MLYYLYLYWATWATIGRRAPKKSNKLFGNTQCVFHLGKHYWIVAISYTEWGTALWISLWHLSEHRHESLPSLLSGHFRIYPLSGNPTKFSHSNNSKLERELHGAQWIWQDLLLLQFFYFAGPIRSEYNFYLVHKFQWPQEGLNCESLAYEVVT